MKAGDPVERLEAYLRERLDQYCASTPGALVENYDPTSRTNRPSGRPFPDEARAFTLGVERGIVDVTETGPPRCEFPGVRFPPRWVLGLFFQQPRPVIRLWWELLTQTMMYVEMVLDYGWPPEQLGVDIDGDCFDGAAYKPNSDEHAPFIVAEAKASASGVERLLSEMRECQGRGCAPEGPTHKDREGGHNKYVGLLRLRPDFLWAVGPDTVRQAFSLEYGAGQALWHPIPDIPRCG